MRILGPGLEIELDELAYCPAEALALVPREWAEQHACVPFGLTTDGSLCLAAANPNAIATFELVCKVTATLRHNIGLAIGDREVEVFFASEAAIERALQRFYESGGGVQ